MTVCPKTLGVNVEPFFYRGLYLTVTSYGQPWAYGIGGDKRRTPALILTGDLTEVLSEEEVRRWVDRDFDAIVRVANNLAITSWDGVPWVLYKIDDTSVRADVIVSFKEHRD